MVRSSILHYTLDYTMNLRYGKTFKALFEMCGLLYIVSGIEF